MLLTNWFKYGQLIICSICLLPTTGCAMHCGNYKYLDFASNPDAHVLRSGVPKLYGLRDVKPFPLSYVINRPSYQIKLRVDETAYGSTIDIGLESKREIAIHLIAPPDIADPFLGCFSFRKSSNTDVKVLWHDRKSCIGRKHIDLSVRHSSGEPIAMERLSFEVITNGRYCVPDAL